MNKEPSTKSYGILTIFHEHMKLQNLEWSNCVEGGDITHATEHALIVAYMYTFGFFSKCYFLLWLKRII